MADNIKRLDSMLPTELKGDDRAPMFKAMIALYAQYADEGDYLSERYRMVLDIYSAVGSEIDFIGAMYGVFRDPEELDEPFKNRIVATIIERKTSSTLPELQEAIDSVTESGKLYILENYGNRPCNIYLTGTADEVSIKRSVELIKKFLPAGVMSIIPVASFDKWQNVKDQFTTWSSLGDEGFIW